MSGLDLNFGAKANPTKSQQKKNQVQETSLAKQLQFGLPDTQKVLATAAQQGNTLGASAEELRFLNDMTNASDLEIAAKYGREAVLNRGNYLRQYQQVEETEALTRSPGEFAQDAGVLALQGLGGVGFAAADVVASGIDWATTKNREVVNTLPNVNIPSAAEAVARGSFAFNEAIEDLRSDTGKRQSEQTQLTGQLAQDDYDREFEQIEDPTFLDRIEHEIGSFGLTLENLANNPSEVANLTAQGIGSLAIMGVSVRAIAKANILRQMGTEAGKEFLKTQAGKAALTAQAAKLVPAATAITEGGSAGIQARQEVLAMSEEELMESPEYQKFRKQGLSPEEARSKLVELAGRPAELTGATIGIITGRIAARFEANPIAAGSPTQALTNVAKEGIEETLQEGGNQLASNVGLNQAGLTDDLVEGIGKGAALGLVGGVGTAGAVQAPGAVANVTVRAAQGVGKGFTKALEVRQEQLAQNRDDQSGSGNKAMNEVNARIIENVQKINTTPIQSKLIDAVFETAEDSASYIEMAPELADRAGPNGRLERGDIIELVGQTLRDKNQSDEAKLGYAVTGAAAYDKMRSADSTEVSELIEQLDEGSTDRQTLEALREDLRKVEGSTAAKEAQEFLKNVTREQVEATFGDLFTLAAQENPDPAMVEAAQEVFEVIGRYNPEALTVADYDMVLEQVGSTDEKTFLNVLRENARIAEASEEQKKKILADQEAAGVETSIMHRPKSAVREDILVGGNDNNGLKSIYDHFRNVSDAIVAGRTEDASAAMEEFRNFAKSQVNKMRAYNQAARQGVVNLDDGGVTYDAYGPFGKFTQKGVWMNPNAQQSVALARDIGVDTQAVVDSYNNLLKAYPDIFDAKALRTPELDAKISNATSARIETDPVEPTKPERRIRKDAKPDESLSDPMTPEGQAVKDARIKKAKDEKKAKKTKVQQTTPQPTKDTKTQTKPDETTAKVEAKPEPEAIVEEAVEDVAEQEPETKENLLDFFPDLIEDAEGRNYFLSTFKVVKDQSTFLGSEDVFDTVLSDNTLSANVRKQVKFLRNTVVPALSEALNDKAKEALTKTRGGKKAGSRVSVWVKDLATGEADVLAYRNALSLNFRRRNAEGQGEFDPKIMQAFTMAAVEWVVDAAAKGVPNMKDEDIVKRLNLPQGTNVTQSIRDMVEHGPLVQSALDAVSRNAMTLLGVKADTNQPIKFTQGMMRSMAANVLETITEADWFDIQEAKYESANGPRPWNTVKINLEDAQIKDLVEGLKGSADVFKDVFVSGYKKPFAIGTPNKAISQNVIGQSSNRTTQLEQKVMQRLQSTPHRFVAPMVEFMNVVGDDVFARLAGYKEVNPDTTNVNAAARIESKNKSILRGMEGVRTLMSKTQEYLETNDKTGNVYTTDTFFDWKVSSVGRLQQQGLVTPQGDKIAREMISATNSVLDLKNQEHLDAVWLAVAQALDISVEKQSHADTLAEVQEMVETDLKPAVDMLREWMSTGEFADPEGFADVAQSVETVKGIHALVTVARMKEAIENNTEDMTSFGTALALEADGKTDGPINAMVNMGFGKFTKEQIEVMAKGGLFFTGPQMSLNDYIAGNRDWAGDQSDLYHVSAELFEEKLKRLYTEVTPRVLNVLDTFLPGFAFQEGKFEIGRGLVKNPLTVFLYGSGARGIADKMANAVKVELYDLMSNIADRGLKHFSEHPTFKENPELLDDLQEVFGSGIVKVLEKPVESELSAQMSKNLTDAILETTGDALAEAIDEATGGLKEAMETIRRVSAIQGIAFEDAYIQEVKKRQGKRTFGDLSEKEYADAFEAASKVAPIYFTDAQEFHVAAEENYSGSQTLSESLRGRLSSGATVPMPGEVGVKVQPYLVIGTGDGRMILNIYNEGNEDLGPSLPVFDGVELALDKIKGASAQINGAVWSGWKSESVASTVEEGFARFLRQFDVSKMSEDGRKKLQDLANKSKTNIDTLIKGTERDLVAKAAQNRARKAAMSRMNLWVDHMAGANAPYENKGEVLSGPDAFNASVISDKLNEFYVEELDKERTALVEKKTGDEVQQPTEGLMKFLKENGTQVDNTGVIHITGSKLVPAVTRQTGFSADQKKVFDDLLKNQESLKDFTFFFGNADELNTIREEDYGLTGQKPIKNGAMYPNANVVFIANGSPETVLHEIIHTATAKLIADYYANQEGASEEVTGAMTRLEDLMASFEEMSFAKDTAQDRAAKVLQDELQAYTQEPVKKMAEFLAWNLSNQNLIQVGKDTRVFSPLQKMAARVLQALKSLLGIKSFKGKDFFSNVKFNTEVLILGSQAQQNDRLVAENNAKATTVFEQVYGREDRLTYLETKFQKRITAALKSAADRVSDRDTQRQKAEYAAKYTELVGGATKAVERVAAEGFILNQREKNIFKTIHASMMAGVESNPAAQRRLYELYAHMVKNARPGTLGVLVGKGGIRKNAEGRSDLLATFVALGLVHKPLQAELQGIPGPKNIEDGYSSVDEALRHGANTVINYLTQSAITTKYTAPDLHSQLLSLTDALADIESERQTTADRMIMRPQEIMDEKLSALIETGSQKAVSFIKSKRRDTDGRIKKGAMISAQFIASLGSKELTAQNIGDPLTRMFNETGQFKTLSELVSDFRGRTLSNEKLLDLVNIVRSHIDALRQDYRERVPEILAEKFSRKITRDEWQQMFEGIAQTDLVALGRQRSFEVLSDLSTLPTEIRDAEKRVRELGESSSKRYMEKANALAEWMVNRKVTSNNLLRNAHAITMLLGEGPNRGAVVADPDPALVEAIDDLVSLYAFEKTNQETKDKLQEIAQSEGEGLQFLIGYQASTRGMEMQRKAVGDDGNVSEYNGWKGYAPTATAPGHDLIVRDDSETADLLQRGYVKVGEYHGDKNENYRGTRSYFQSTVGGRASYRQGVAQTVHATYQGVDPRSGRTQTGDTAGYIYGSKARRARTNLGRINNNISGSEQLIPIFDNEGRLIAYERTMDPEMRKALQEEKHLARMLGVWSGRIVEETLSDKFNKQLVETLKDIWNEAVKNGDTSEFVNAADPDIKDKVVKDAWDTMGWKLKEDAAAVFGENKLMVRRDMLNDALGFHQASVRDIFTGTSRWSPEAQKAARDVAQLIMGDNAYKWMVNGETYLTEIMGYAKTNIIIRSGVVMIENIISNVMHLMTWGIGPGQMLKAHRAKFIEINQYVKNQERTLELNAELAAKLDDPRASRRIKAELQAIEDVNNSMSIKPLLDAGEFSTVAESLTEADQALREGKLSHFLEYAADKLPGAAQTAFKNFAITKDTALYQGLNRVVQYSDFVAKAVLYEHLMQNKSYSEKEAMDVIKEEFVNYNRLAGRSRDYVESIGLVWFFNYKIRIMKIMTRMLRERPASALFYAGGVGPMADIDTVVSGSGLGAYLDNRLGYAIGPEMGVNGLTMNPWLALME